VSSWSPEGPPIEGYSAAWASGEGPEQVLPDDLGWYTVYALDPQVIVEQSIVADQGLGSLRSSPSEQAFILDAIKQMGIRSTGVGQSVASDQAVADFAAKAATSVQYGVVGTYNYAIPVWCKYLDVVLLGGGASGQTGNGAVNQPGSGGHSGKWQGYKLTRGVEIPWTATTVVITVGAGGARPADSDYAGPTPGANTTFSVASSISGLAAGGNGTNDGSTRRDGLGAPAFTYGGIVYPGGANSTSSAQTGTTPGGGGAGGNGGIFGNRTRGGAGGPGAAWVRAYQ
jgi:hypothetical protein